MSSFVAVARVEELPPGARWTIPDGGLYLWVRLPEGVSALALYRAALAHDVVVAPGDGLTRGQNRMAGSKSLLLNENLGRRRKFLRRLAHFAAAVADNQCHRAAAGHRARHRHGRRGRARAG